MKIIADRNQPLIREAFAQLGEVVVLPVSEITPAVLRDATALIVRSTIKVDENLLRGSAVKFVGTFTIGFDHVDLTYLHSAKIGFAAAAGCNANSVSEYFCAAMLTYAVEKKLDLRDKTVGVIGVGNVGKLVAEKARALQMRVLLNDPPRAKIEGAQNFVDLSTLLKESDFVTLHVPLEKNGADATYKMANDDFFAAMKNGAVFINSARGKVIDDAALLNALNRGKIAAAILDVFYSEPQISPVLLPKLFLATPHIAGYSYNGKVNGTKIIFAALCKYFNINATWNAQPFMPSPEISHIDIQSDADFYTEMDDVVSAIYNIRADSKRFFATPEKFRELRDHYPQRLEFPHTTIAVPKKRRDLRDGLRACKFVIEEV